MPKHRFIGGNIHVPRLIWVLVFAVMGQFPAGRVEAGWLPGFSGGSVSGKGAPADPDLPDTAANIGTAETVLAVAVVEGLALGNAWLAREAPVPYGVGMIVLSPLASMKNLNGWGNAALMAGVAGLGVYNYRNRGTEPARRRERFWVTYAGIHLVILPAYGADYLTGGKHDEQAGSSFSPSLEYDPDRGVFMLTAGF